MTKMVRMVVEFEEEFYDDIATGITRTGADIVWEEDFESEDD